MKYKTLIKSIPATLILGILSAGLFFGCQSQSGNLSLGPVAPASFTVDSIAGMTNHYLLTSTTKNTFMYEWNTGNGNGWKKGSKTDTAYFPLKGNYTVSLRVFSKGGYDSTSHSINVPKNDPNGCFGNKKILTGGCTSQTWVLKSGAGAYLVGPANLSTVYYSNPASDTTVRSCLFDDEWTFNKDGTMVFKTNGDMWVDSDVTNPYPSDILKNGVTGTTPGCFPMTDINPKYSAWGDGTHKYQVIGSNLTLIGNGAFLGLYKAGNNATTPVPENTITYQIKSITPTQLVVVDVLGKQNLAWQFTFVPKH